MEGGRSQECSGRQVALNAYLSPSSSSGIGQLATVDLRYAILGSYSNDSSSGYNVKTVFRYRMCGGRFPICKLGQRRAIAVGRRGSRANSRGGIYTSACA